MFLRLKDFGASHTDIPATTVWPQLLTDFEFSDRRTRRLGALQEAITEQSGGVADRKSAGVSIDETIARGITTVRKMDAVVKNFYRNNAAVLSQWETARHVGRAPRRKVSKAETPPARPEQPK